MPELAEVEFYRRSWTLGLGQRISQAEALPRSRVFRPELREGFPDVLVGADLTSARAHGKQLLFGFGDSGWMGVHLGMTGALRCLPPGTIAGRHDHLLLRQSARTLVFHDPRMFGRIRFHPGPASRLPEWWTNLPPELLSRAFSTRLMAAHLARCARTPLKAVLLDQARFPGIGNWMADEILWRCRLDPAVPGAHLGPKDIARLRREIREVAREALRIIAPDWTDPPETWLFRHRWRDGGHCPRRGCGGLLRRDAIRSRTTCWCPDCQKPITR